MKKSSKVRIYTIDGIKYMVKMTKLKYVEAFSDETNCFTGILQIKTPTKTYLWNVPTEDVEQKPMLIAMEKTRKSLKFSTTI